MTLFHNKAEFEKVFRQYYTVLCNAVKPMLDNDVAQAEDVVQEVMIHIWNKRETLPQVDNLGAYLLTAVKRKALESLRKSANEKRLELLRSNTPTQEDENVDRELLKEKIYHSIRQLPTKCGEVFTMNKINGLTYTEIADAKGISVKTVENHMGKAFKLLRANLYGKIYD